MNFRKILAKNLYKPFKLLNKLNLINNKTQILNLISIIIMINKT